NKAHSFPTRRSSDLIAPVTRSSLCPLVLVSITTSSIQNGIFPERWIALRCPLQRTVGAEFIHRAFPSRVASVNDSPEPPKRSATAPSRVRAACSTALPDTAANFSPVPPPPLESDTTHPPVAHAPQ